MGDTAPAKPQMRSEQSRWKSGEGMLKLVFVPVAGHVEQKRWRYCVSYRVVVLKKVVGGSSPARAKGFKVNCKRKNLEGWRGPV